MRTVLAVLALTFGLACFASADQIEGLIVDQSCGPDIVKNGRVATLNHRPECSLKTNYKRQAYGLVTTDKHFYTFDQAGNQKALQMLKGTPDPDNCVVVVTGDVKGDVVNVKYMTML